MSGAKFMRSNGGVVIVTHTLASVSLNNILILNEERDQPGINEQAAAVASRAGRCIARACLIIIGGMQLKRSHRAQVMMNVSVL
jgi:hypothetical protein